MKIVLFGYYGFGNVGDEKCLDQTIHLIRSIVPFSSVIIATGPYSLPFETFSRWNIALWFYHLFTAKVLVMGGGSVFQSHTSFLSLLYYLMIVLVAKLLRCKVIILCHGWGPFKQYWHQKLATYIKKNTNRSWRTNQIPFKDDPLFCDLALLQSPYKDAFDLGDRIAVSLRSFDKTGHSFRQFLSQKSKVLFIENQPKKQKNERHILLDAVWDVPPKSLGLVITDRFHTAIWASRHGIPWVSVSDDPKLIGLAQLANMPTVSFDDELDWSFYLANRSLSDSLKQWSTKQYKQVDLVKAWLNENLSI